MFEKVFSTKRSRMLLMALCDIFACLISCFVALWVRFDFSIDNINLRPEKTVYLPKGTFIRFEAAYIKIYIRFFVGCKNLFGYSKIMFYDVKFRSNLIRNIRNEEELLKIKRTVKYIISVNTY